VRTQLAIRLHALLERTFPEKRLFLKSDDDMRFIRLRPGTQAIAMLGGTLVVGWAILATAILLMDAIGGGNFREQARRDLETYQARLNDLADQRDARAAEALAAQARFDTALQQVSVMQSELLASETRLRELETGLEIMQAKLRDKARERDAAQERLAMLERALEEGGAAPGQAPGDDATVTFLTRALAETAAERDRLAADAEEALLAADRMATELRLTQDRNETIFRQLEEAMLVSVEPLDAMFERAGLDPDRLLDEVRRGYSGLGGPLTPISFSTRGAPPDPSAERAGRILNKLDELNLYRIAAQKAPFALPVKGSFRFTSGFGMRWGRMHNGADFAAAHGSPIYATADGIVTHAGWLSGYGRLVKIQHEFGIETRYAHMSRIRVKEGQRVSRGDRIGDMGNSGRSTGTHLHYEVRVGGKAVNPMIYIKAARDVF
jgi:murein DD-endopeptidase MepM/ murein hydrolase activator NlpD